MSSISSGASAPPKTRGRDRQHEQHQCTRSSAGPFAMDPLMAKLKALVSTGEYCGNNVDTATCLQKLERARDLYIESTFSFADAVATNAAVLVYVGASDVVAGYREAGRLPSTPAHVRAELKLASRSSIATYIEDRAQAFSDEGVEGPLDQCVETIPGYHSRLDVGGALAHVFPHEMWLQVGSRETPMHVDHGRTVAYLPPCQKSAFKIWVFFRTLEDARAVRVRNTKNSLNRMLACPSSVVIIQRPGDVVFVNHLVYHAVMLGYEKGTPAKSRWAAIGGNVVILHQDRVFAHRYATQAVSAVVKGSKDAWQRVLPAFCAMEGRRWSSSRFEEEKKHFLRELEKDPVFAARRKAFNARKEREKNRKRKRSTE